MRWFSSCDGGERRAITLSFDVASIKPCKPDDDQPNSNFPLGPGDVYTPNGGLFRATGQPAWTYLSFAYKLNGNQLQSLMPQLPSWISDHYDIEARASSDPGKDGMRMMMRALLADRFKFKIHDEARQVPVLAMVLIKPGTLGPRLWAHPTDAPCSTESAPGPNVLHTPAGDLPKLCNGIYPMQPAAQRGRYAIRGSQRHHRIHRRHHERRRRPGPSDHRSDRHSATVDFILEFTFQPKRRSNRRRPMPSLRSTCRTRLRAQLGIKLVSQKGPFNMMIVRPH